MTNSSSKPLTGRVALVTGSSSGIGLGIATVLAEAGAAVMLNGGRAANAFENSRAALEGRTGAKVRYTAADVTKATDFAALVTTTEKELGGVDILVNNAGIQHVAPIDEFPIDKWEQVIQTNLLSCFYGIRAVLPGMKSRSFGRIVNIASAHGLIASPFKSAYVAAKHGLVGLTKTVALEVAQLDITCNAICPGYVLTPLVEGQIEGQAKAHNMPRDKVIRDVILESQPNKRFIGVEELGALTLFLCGEGGRSITGAALPVDGAWTSR